MNEWLTISIIDNYTCDNSAVFYILVWIVS